MPDSEISINDKMHAFGLNNILFLRRPDILVGTC